MKTLHEAFKSDSSIIVPEGLLARVLFHIDAEAQRLARRYKIMWGGVFVGSLGLFIGSAIHTARIIAGSNFGSYFSLIFSDSGMIFTIWKQLLLSMIESFPLLETIILLGSITVVLWSIRNFFKNTNFYITQTNAHVA